MTSGLPRSVVVVKKTTREIVGRYPSAVNAELCTGVNRDKIVKECSRKCLGRGYHYWRFEDEFDPNENFGNVGRYRPILAANKDTGHWMWFESLVAAGYHFYGNEHGARIAMKDGRTKDGYAFVYADRRMRREKCEVEA